MPLPIDLEIQFEKYKSFKDLQIIKGIKPINIIIGRNNTGKSAILDVIEYLNRDGAFKKDFSLNGNNQFSPRVLVKKSLTESELRRSFPNNVSGGIYGGNHWDFALNNYLGKPVLFELLSTGEKQIIEITPNNVMSTSQSIQTFTQDIEIPFAACTVRRLLADRNIQREPVEGAREITVTPSGEYATRTIYNLLNYNGYDNKIIERKFVDVFNTIFAPDMKVSRIIAKDINPQGTKEIFLEEENKGLIPLSASGSGIKTVILVLLNTIVFPDFYHKGILSGYVFLFEELENNLHAHTLRNLFDYLYSLAVSQECTFFITTHSNVVIDLFDNNPNAQIIHVQHKNGNSTLNVASEWLEKNTIIDDLGIRGSDLLQSNGIIWVEGPSDRIYLNKWIELISHGELKEGKDYQCLFYGGRLLSHFSSNDQAIDDYISMLRVNRNLAVLMDSDRSKSTDEINQTKMRIVTEVEKLGGLAWVTEGREIENYILPKLVTAITSTKPRKYTRAKNFKLPSNDKVIFARTVCESTELGHLDHLDLRSKLEELVKLIESWNL